MCWPVLDWNQSLDVQCSSLSFVCGLGLLKVYAFDNVEGPMSKMHVYKWK